MGFPEPLLPTWQVLSWAMGQASCSDPGQVAHWVCLQGTLPEEVPGAASSSGGVGHSTELGL